MTGSPNGPLWDPGDVPVDRREWLAAAVVAGLRVESNRNRAGHRSRGRAKDVLNDIQGVVGEIVGLRELERRHGAGSVMHELLHWGGGTGQDVQEAVDFAVMTGSGQNVRLESKCHLDGERKRMLLINAVAHDRSGRRGAIGYLPLVGALGRPLMRIGRLISHDEVDRWETYTYQYGDPARRRKLTDVSPVVFAESWARLRARLLKPREAASEKTLREVTHGAMHRFSQLKSSGFDLTGLTYSELVERASAEARGCWNATKKAA